MIRGLVLLAVLGACAEPEIMPLDVQQTRVATFAARANPATQLDVLFVVDDSPAMAPVQEHLAAALQPLAVELDSLVVCGAPDVHVGVITGDLCTPHDVVIPYLTDRVHAGVRQRSYTGTLVAALGAMLDVGAVGCDRPQLLEAMRRALSSPANAGFVRPHALLQVIVITDEDDRSGDDPGAYARFLTGLKPPGAVMVDGAIGPCAAASGAATAAPRLQSVIDGVGRDGEAVPICEDDLADALCVIERFEPEHPGLACLDATLATPPVCTISDVQRFGRADQAEQLLPACDASGRVPCWHAVDDPSCSTGSEIRIERGDLEIPFDDEVVGNCVPG